MSIQLIFDLDKPDRSSGFCPKDDLPADVAGPAAELLRDKCDIPQVAEPEVVRHFVNLSTLNHHVDKGFYPLGSCTMKYNPKINETVADMPGFSGIHPHQPPETVQGALKLMHELESMLCEITGLPAITLQPAAGAHGELTAMFMVKAYHTSNRNPRTKVLTPDSSHGTNPASIVMAGYEPVSIPSNANGRVDLETLKAMLDEEVAAIMITNPNTIGLFESEIATIAAAVHEVGGLMYMDGANMNALMGIARPGDMGFDLVHLNLHKTFSTPHGGGGPGSGPVAVIKELEPFLPRPRIIELEDEKLDWDWDRPESVGQVHGNYGNFGMHVRALTYICALGQNGLSRASQIAILNANYIRRKLDDVYLLPFKETSMHEVVFSSDWQGKNGIKAMDIAKRLLDFDIHAPTINFPLIIHEAMMIEPTETESLETLDRFIEVMHQIDREAKENPEILKNAPHNTPVSRFNEAAAARALDIVCEVKG